MNTLTGENLPISVAIEKGLIFTELIDQQPRRFVQSFIIEHVIDPMNNRQINISEAIRSGLINSTISHFNHPAGQRPLTLSEAHEQGYLIGRFVEQLPNTFVTDHRHQVSYLITSVIDNRTDRVYTLPDGMSLMKTFYKSIMLVRMFFFL